MNTESNRNESSQSTRLPEWSECELFCIHDYAAAGASPCGWRGRIRDAHHDETGMKPFCPRCGCATLFRIPLSRTDA